MQIWFLDKSPAKSAEILCKKSPKRARKYVVEFMQATAAICAKKGLPFPKTVKGDDYKFKLASRFPKPLMNWLNEKSGNYAWAFDLAKEVNKIIDCSKILTEHNLQVVLVVIFSGNHTISSFPNYAKSKSKGLDFTHYPVHEAYNKYLDAQL